jgi:osmoprotectant transport system substrate-binding protein
MKRTLLALTAAAALLLAGCGGDEDPLEPEETDSASGDDSALVVGSANFPENVLLMEIYAQALDDAGVETETRPNIGAREAYIAGLEDGSIDLIPEYTGNLRLYFNPEATQTEPGPVFLELRESLPETLTVLDFADAQDKDAVVVTGATAKKYSLTTIADLAPVAKDLTLGGPPEWKTRRTGVPGLEEVYGVTFKDFVELDAGGPQTLQGLLSGRIDAGNIFTTNPNLVTEDLVVLRDPESLFAAQNVVPLLRTDAVTDDVTATLNQVSAVLDTVALTQMMSKVEIDKEDPEDVASEWLVEAGLS